MGCHKLVLGLVLFHLFVNNLGRDGAGVRNVVAKFEIIENYSGW